MDRRALLAGARYASLWRAALAGVAATLAALLGFYVAQSAVILDLGPHPWYVDLELTFQAGRMWATWGLLSGVWMTEVAIGLAGAAIVIVRSRRGSAA